jgi:hypothetical protein
VTLRPPKAAGSSGRASAARPPALPAARAAGVGALLCLLLLSWSLVHHTSDARYWISDTGLYQQYGDAVVRGAVPYRDFALEYPPGAIPVFVLPALGHTGDRAAYDRVFDREMALCACLALIGVALALRGARHRPLALVTVAAAPLLLGPVVLSRFDYWPAALAALALAAFVHRRLPLAAILLGAAIAAKLWPAVLVVPLVVQLLRLRGARAAAAFLGGTAAVVAAIVVPLAALAPGGVGHSLHAQFSRPLQLESLGGALVVASHHLFGTSAAVVTTFGSQNVPNHALELALDVLLALGLLATWVLFARGEPSDGRLLAACAASVAAVLAFGKVFSPQFLIWLVPFVPLVPSATAVTLLVAALLLTQSWFPRHYWELAQGLHPLQSWELLARDLVVVALFATLTGTLRRARAPRPASAAAAAPAPPAPSARRGVRPPA